MVDYLIIGQGLCGTWLSYYLLKAGKKVMVVDNNQPHTASRIASGVINPVTGRRIVRTWRIEELLPFAIDAYAEMGSALGVTLANSSSVLDFHPSLQMKEAFEKRLNEEQEYLHTASQEEWQPYFNFFFGVGKVEPCLLVDINTLLTTWRKHLREKQSLLEESFDLSSCTVREDEIVYHNIIAGKVIFCDGVTCFDNSFFKNLPFAPNKGEAIIARIEGLPRHNIYKHGISIVPWQNDLSWIGSSYEWSFSDTAPTAAFREKMTRLLKNWLKLTFEIVDHLASVRPATLERRPFVGLHPAHPAVGILNGMGTKGCSLAPFFAKQLALHLTQGEPIYADADVKRFIRTLSGT